MSQDLLPFIEAILDTRNKQQDRFVLRHDLSPDCLRDKIQISLDDAEEGLAFSQLKSLITNVQDYSVNTQHPLFMNQLYGHVSEMGLLGDFLAASLNTSMATWEIAPLMTLIEKEVIKQMAQLIGFESYDGLLTPGGSLSNMQAMLMAKDQRFPEARVKGAASLPAVRIFVSDQAHYSFVKFAQVIGLGQDSVVKVASFARGAMQPEALQKAIDQEKKAGHLPLMIAATAGTTVSGVYDDLNALQAIAKKEQLWFHVDGSYGGSLLISSETRHFLAGISEADSVAWNPHKMLGMPFHCPALITRHKGALEASLSTDASYLFHEDETEFNLGQKSLHCGRRVEALKFWLAWHAYGRKGLAERVLTMRQAALDFAAEVKKRPYFQLLCEPEAPLVCFQYLAKGFDHEANNRFNQAIRETIFAQGRLLLNYAHIDHLTVLRCVISSPEFELAHALEILDTVEKTAQALLETAPDL